MKTILIGQRLYFTSKQDGQNTMIVDFANIYTHK